MAQSNDAVIDATMKLVESNDKLKGEVHALSERLSAKEVLHRRTRNLTLLSIGIGLLAVIGLIISGYVIYENNRNVEVNLANAKVNCQNANDSREANKKIWTLVVQATTADPDRTTRDIDNTQKFQDYIEKLYAPRDCDNLSKRYVIPDPPEFKF